MTNRIGKNIKAVFFDHDDTLVATFEAKSAHHKHVAKTHYGKDLSDAEIRLHWGKPLPELVSLLYETDDREQALANNVKSRARFPKGLFDGSLEILAYLHKKGILVGIVTATSRSSFENDLTLHNFPRESIDYTQTADDTSFHKPDPKVFEPAIAWLQERGVKPEEVLYVADGLHDMKAAIGAGFNFIGVETGFPTKEDFLKEGIFSVPTIADINKLID